MGTTYRFIADPTDQPHVVEWFSSLSPPPEQVSGQGCLWLHFRQLGSLAITADGSVDLCRSPVVSVVPPRQRRGLLWTVGEVHFTPTPLRTAYPDLHKMNFAFRKWLASFECVFDNKPHFKGEWNHYLEGTVKNFDPPVFAFPSGLAALRDGRYFVADTDTESTLDTLCLSLRLRGLQCDEPAWVQP